MPVCESESYLFLGVIFLIGSSFCLVLNHFIDKPAYAAQVTRSGAGMTLPSFHMGFRWPVGRRETSWTREQFQQQVQVINHWPWVSFLAHVSIWNIHVSSGTSALNPPSYRPMGPPPTSVAPPPLNPGKLQQGQAMSCFSIHVLKLFSLQSVLPPASSHPTIQWGQVKVNQRLRVSLTWTVWCRCWTVPSVPADEWWKWVSRLWISGLRSVSDLTTRWH